MPIYEFVCQSCQRPFEELVRTKDQSVRCPECGGTELRRQFSAFATGASAPKQSLSAGAGGCSRCGDPDGPCGF